VTVDASLPEPFVEHAVIPVDPYDLPAGVIAGNRADWVERWVEIVLG
jgi:hypothetical protein